MFLFRYLLRHYKLILALIVVSVAAAILAGFGVTLVFPVLDGMTGSGNTLIPFPFNKIASIFSGMPLSLRIQIAVILILVSTVIRCGLLYLGLLLGNRLQIHVIRHYRMACVDQVMKVGMNYFNKQRGADFQFIFDGCTDAVAGAIVHLIANALPELLTSVLLLLFLVALSWKLTLVSLVLVVAASLVLNLIMKKILEAGQGIVDSRFQFNRILFDLINGMKLIRLFNREEYMVGKYSVCVDRYNEAKYEAEKLSGAAGPIFEVTGMIILAAILFIGSLLIPQNGGAWLGILLTFLFILTRIIAPVKSLNQARATIISKLPALRALGEFLGPIDKAYINSGKICFHGLRHGIELRNAEFAYNPQHAIVLQDVCLSVPKGSKVGIVGPSGSGKSTLTEVLLRFYDLQKGQILVDGVDLKELDLSSWRKHIGVVSQDTFLFNDTVRANIAFANLTATHEEMENAARKAYAHEFISALPNGYDTYIGDRGVLLSGGQRQRLAIARAIIADPEILIFDEATSSLDTQAERVVQEALNNVSQGKTVIAIAHRLSTVSDSDIIFVIEKGRIVEQGKHLELMQKSGLYRKLVKMQSLASL
ncbi:MAG: ABC transporter ATP-binding protein [Candidatus Margulisiibacteriota bacterium]